MIPENFPYFAIGLSIVLLIALGLETWIIIDHQNFHALSIIRLMGLTVIVAAVIFLGMLLLLSADRGKELLSLIAVLGTVAGAFTKE